MGRLRDIIEEVRENAGERQDARRENRANGGGVANRVRDIVASGRDRAAANRQAREDAKAAQEEREADILAAKVAKKIAASDPRVTKQRTRPAGLPRDTSRGVTRDLPRGETPAAEMQRPSLAQRILQGSTMRTDDVVLNPSSAPTSQPSSAPTSRPSETPSGLSRVPRDVEEPSSVGLYIGVGVGVVGAVGLLWWVLK